MIVPRARLPTALAALAPLALAACDDAIDVRLIAPAGESARPVDYACVNRVEVVLYSNLPDRVQCVPIAPGRVDTLRDHHLSGLLDLDLPAGFAAIDVRGVRSDDDGCAADTVFHGEGYYGGGWTVDVPLTHALDCRDFTTSPTAAQLLDLAKLEAGAADRCAPPANASGYQVFLQHQYPYDLSGDLVPSADRPLGAVPVSAAGTATLAGPHFTGAVDASCMTLGTGVAPAGAQLVTTCVDAGAPTLCAPAGAVELIAITPAMFASFATAQTVGAALSIGLVWDSATRRPLAGATITPVAGSNTFGFRYFDYAAGAVTMSAATATTAAGLFALEIGAPTLVEVRAPGRPTRRVALAAGSDQVPGVQSIPM